MVSLDLDAISGIAGSVSIACWVVVFSPQIIENFRRSSAEGLSIAFIIIWLAGDIFNIAGALLQGVLPTMIILAIYYTLADIVLLGQCLYYRGFNINDNVPKSVEPEAAISSTTERSALLRSDNDSANGDGIHRSSSSVFRDTLKSLDGTHLSPATPLHQGTRDADVLKVRRSSQKSSVIKAILFNLTAILVVCAAGVGGWYLSSNRSRQQRHTKEPKHKDEHEAVLQFNVLGQVFGYICAALYLGSRVPQLLLNYRRKSTEGISMLFFIFACIGNLAYVVSILAYDPICQRPQHCMEGEVKHLYGRYFAVNFSWLLGSFGTLLLDACVFVQFFRYRKQDDEATEN